VSFLYSEEIAIGYGYTGGQPVVAHLGLGPESECDVDIVFPHGLGVTARSGVKADNRLVNTK
jgi:hypothetical protein